jgi:SAM-dependent methyltransferase
MRCAFGVREGETRSDLERNVGPWVTDQQDLPVSYSMTNGDRGTAATGGTRGRGEARRIHRRVLAAQQAYYDARGAGHRAELALVARDEVRAWRMGHPDSARAVRRLRRLGPFSRVLELAGGSGAWTAELARLSTDVAVLDGSPEMLAANRLRNRGAGVRYRRVDLFDWRPRATYDLVFSAFFLSHVPESLLEAFLDKIRRAVRPGGLVFLVDEPPGDRPVTGPNEDGMYQTRRLDDGRAFRIVKVFYDPAEIQAKLAQRGFAPVETVVGEDFFHLVARRR